MAEVKKISIVDAILEYQKKLWPYEGLCVKEHFVLGKFDDFDFEPMKEFSEKCKFFVENDTVFAISHTFPRHEIVSKSIGLFILNAFEDAYEATDPVQGLGFQEIPMWNMKHGGRKFFKQPDESFNFKKKFRSSELIKDPVITVEVGYMHENLDLLLRQAEVSLNQSTNIPYVFVANIIEDEEGKVVFDLGIFWLVHFVYVRIPSESGSWSV